MSPVHQKPSGNFSTEKITSTRAFLSKLSASFSEKEFRTLANFFFDPHRPVDLFEALLIERVIQPNNLSKLFTVLEIIGRNDLKEKVTLQQPQAFRCNQVVNPTPEALPTPQHLAFPPYGTTSSKMLSPTTPCTDHYNGEPCMEQNPTMQKLVIGSSPPVLGSLIAEWRVVRGNESSAILSISTAQLERELRRSRESEERLSLQLKQLSKLHKEQQELIKRIEREKILAQENFCNSDSY